MLLILLYCDDWLVGTPLDFRHVVLHVLEHASLFEDVWQVQRMQYGILPQARGCGRNDDLILYLEISVWEVAMMRQMPHPRIESIK